MTSERLELCIWWPSLRRGENEERKGHHTGKQKHFRELEGLKTPDSHVETDRWSIGIRTLGLVMFEVNLSYARVQIMATDL